MPDIRIHAFLIYKDPLERRETRDLASLQRLLEEAGRAEGVVAAYTYSLVGLRRDADFAVWLAAGSLEPVQAVAATFHRAGFPLAHTLWGYVKPSQYTGQDGVTMKVPGARKPYLVIYPFVKTHAWYQMTPEERRNLMNEHIAIGKKFPAVDQLLVYSVGLTDDEFVVAYETEDLAYFSNLVAALREVKGRVYTERDTPIFTCRHCPAPELVAQLRGAAAREEAGIRV